MRLKGRKGLKEFKKKRTCNARHTVKVKMVGLTVLINQSNNNIHQSINQTTFRPPVLEPKRKLPTTEPELINGKRTKSEEIRFQPDQDLGKEKK